MITPAVGLGPARGVGAVQLTQAEREVLGYVLLGLANKEIASALNKAEPTVKHQVSSILLKHRVPSRARLIAQFR